MKKVTLIFSVDKEHGKQMIGVSETVDGAIKLLKKSGYGWDMGEQELAIFAILGYTTNREVNFKLETWEVN